MTAFVWAVEFMGVKHGNIVATVLNVVYAVVSMMSPLTMLVTDDWRQMAYLYVVAGICAFVSMFWIEESPRTLVTVLKNYDEARKVFRKIARRNGVEQEFNYRFYEELHENNPIEESPISAATPSKSKALILLATNKDARGITWVTVYIWFAVALCFFGIDFSIPLLPTGVFLSGLILSFVEIVSVSSSAYLQDRFGRKSTMRLFLAMVGFTLPSL
eukprot:CAMPEP_0114973726 /NCGR_PEP_ID=MMETSP0216-20121206/1121_1 /TAXON_ID=223996 /ORGANISM="Protocruzia adherens, Strain Boccale" /LENGTH=215 /DNA_ID=CAMNT_0002334263 /DNA_START=195 /DNA_END=839 /DNA_ORIENTATION=-